MTSTKHSRPRGITARGIWAVLLTCIFVMAVALGVVFYDLQSLQSCNDRYQQASSTTDKVRAEASAKAAVKLKDVITTASPFVDPDLTPGMNDLRDSQEAFAAYITAADEYEAVIEANPKREYQEFCG